MLSPGLTDTSDASLQVVATPEIEQLRAVVKPFLSIVSVQLAEPPGAVVRRTWRSVMVVPTLAIGISTALSVGETRETPQAMNESFVSSVIAPAPASKVEPSVPFVPFVPAGPDGPAG